jgi:hypothetical protein
MTSIPLSKNKLLLSFLLFLYSGSAFTQVPLSEKNISLDEVQVKPQEPKMWVKKGRTPLIPFPLGGHNVRLVDSLGKQSPPIALLNKIKALSTSTIQITSLEAKLEPFDNDSFNVFFLAMQIVANDTLLQRKLIIGKDIRKRRCTLEFEPGEFSLLPQTVYLGFEVVPNKVSTVLNYKVLTSPSDNTQEFFYYYFPESSRWFCFPELGSTFNLKLKYYDQLL